VGQLILQHQISFMPDFGICMLSVIPCRKEPSDAAEMVTQLLFGEHYEIKEKRKKWYRIQNCTDGYDCWIDRKQHSALDEKFADRLNKQKFVATCLELATIVQNQRTSEIVPILMGSSLPFLEEGQFKIAKEVFAFEGNAQLKPEKRNREALIQHAMTYMNAPYLWGGRQPFGIDCSGLVQICYKMLGINLPRDAYQQASCGHALSFLEEAEPGDLAFFDNEEGRIIHVGILLENHRIIHASGKVRIDRIDHQGIYNNDISDYSHRLRIIKRIDH